ncbi:unnamed protein product, partial [Lampetra planeri]
MFHHFIGLILLLSLPASNAVTSGRNGFLQVTTRQSEVWSQKTTASTTDHEEETTEVTPPQTFSNPAAQTNTPSQGVRSTTEVTYEVTTGAITHTSHPTTSASTQFTTAKTPHVSKRPTATTNHSAALITKPVENKTKPGAVTRTTGASTTPLVRITEAKKEPEPADDQSINVIKPGKVVAGLIGGALVLMMLGLLVVYGQKRKYQKQQITTSDWAGPSPFLEGGAGDGEVTLKSSNHISLSSFLPQRLSKRWNLLSGTNEEFGDTTPGTTFGLKRGSGSEEQRSSGPE